MLKIVPSDKKKHVAVKSKYSALCYADLTGLYLNGRKDTKRTVDQEAQEYLAQAQKLSPEQAKAYQELLRLGVFN